MRPDALLTPLARPTSGQGAASAPTRAEQASSTESDTTMHPDSRPLLAWLDARADLFSASTRTRWGARHVAHLAWVERALYRAYTEASEGGAR